MPASIRKLWRFTLAILLACASMSMAQEGATSLELSAGAALSAASAIDGVLIAPQWSPALDIQYRNNNFFIDADNGVGFALFRNEPIHIGTMLNYQYGRSESADSHYRGMGDVVGSIAPAVFIEWEPIPNAIDIYLNGSKAISGSTGWLYKLEISGGIPVSAKTNAYFDFTGNASDKSYAQAYYGVTAEQALASHYRPYIPSAGWSTLTSELGLEYRYSKKLSLNTQLGQLRYLDNAARSPLTSKNTYAIATLSTTYRY